MPVDQIDVAVEHLREAFAGQAVSFAGTSGADSLQYVTPRPQLGWVLGAGDYAAAAGLLQQQQPDVVLLLGADATTLPASSLRALVDMVRTGVDLALPRYPLGPHDGLVSSALLYPLTRTLFTTDIRFPLPVDAALSARMLSRLAALANRAIGPAGTESLIWPVAEASVAGFQVRQVEMPARTLPPPADGDLNSLLAAVAGSFFADVEAKATYWQRGRVMTAASAATSDQSFPSFDTAETASMLEAFQLASNNLMELWALVLPPQTLLAVKKLSRLPAGQFTMDASLWARIVYDFALAFHARSLNRGHLLGAMTPLYLAWAASYIHVVGDSSERAARQIESIAQAFEREKPYFVSRWRWPDRFNP